MTAQLIQNRFFMGIARSGTQLTWLANGSARQDRDGPPPPDADVGKLRLNHERKLEDTRDEQWAQDPHRELCAFGSGGPDIAIRLSKGAGRGRLSRGPR